METGSIVWTGSPDDQTARINDYMLRAEKMDGEWSWFGVYYKSEDLDYGFVDTIEEAKTACEKAYKEHLKTQP